MTTSATGKADPQGHGPRAFTLIEVLLVLTLLVVIAAAAAPSMNSGLWRSRMNEASSKVRTAWARARLEAAANGEALRFQCRIGSGWGVVGPATAPLADVEAELDAEAESAGDEFELSGIVFRQLLVAPQPGDPPIGAGVEEGSLSAAVLFRPDGSATDAEAILEDESGRQVRVSLRGLTGAATVEDVEAGQ